MAFFEEAADTIKTESYNLRAVCLNQTDEGEFYFNITVNNVMINIIKASL